MDDLVKRGFSFPLLLSSLLFVSPTLEAVTPEECSTVSRAHELLLEGSFEVERTFRLSVNGDLKKREVAHLTYSGGQLVTEVLEYESLSKLWAYENEGRDSVLEIEFACDRLEAFGDDRYELTSEDALEVAEFELDGRTGALRLIAWRSDDTARLLFKKFAIAARAEYSGFSWNGRLPQ